MWYEAYGGSDKNDKPSEIDTSSKKWVRVRKNIRFVEGNDIIEPHWEWMEKKISKEDWELFKSISNHDAALDDVYAALTELAELIVGG